MKFIKRHEEGEDLTKTFITFGSYKTGKKRIYMTLPSISRRNSRRLKWVSTSWIKIPFTKPTYWVWSRVPCSYCKDCKQ